MGKNQCHEKTYIIQRRVDSGQRTATGGKASQEVIRATVGNVSDFANIDQARETARNFAQTMKQMKRSPNAIISRCFLSLRAQAFAAGYQTPVDYGIAGRLGSNHFGDSLIGLASWK
ncbi:hypothetical protein [Pectobacterium cacticida]|uniref:hypothetical protein n=1 Tax=Pectobacterium cacticida TaxID=69221 RepID=UPI002FF313AD